MGKPENHRVLLAYDGAAFAGWARQPGLRTVEGALLAALGGLDPAISAIHVAGRTDRGVSATGQVISFRGALRLSPAAIADAIEAAAPEALAVLEARRVGLDFHARWSARSRSYVYIAPGRAALAPAVDALLAPLLGRRDFGAFARDTPAGKSTVRTMSVARARAVQDDLRFDFTADGFLRRQVRVMVATALALAETGDPDASMLALARGDTSRPAASEGLCLVRVGYDA